ncbi:hypothetical protein BDN71DRAFT_1441689 [Pleurotus eryngii]|uniref:Phosphatidate phosphatase APP1 catalytic domain-containing protein n=1 Tax=Pleurotus eryngii TaxID=5323 RepID=A0A9P6A5V8_PLEER|nr:hypothetical protein BDN71DRAFT_1441689 [Pleurotus eryngii]
MNPPTAWRSLVAESSRRSISSLRNLKVAAKQSLERLDSAGVGARSIQDGRQSWRDWAGEKIRSRRFRGSEKDSGPDERISLFPGWAAKRYRDIGDQNLPEAFEVDVFVSGYASSHKSPANASRSQRAFMRLAKSFAALPKLMADVADPGSEPSTPLSRSTEDLLATVKLPPRPSEITEDYEVQLLEQTLKRAKHEESTDSLSSPGDRLPFSANPALLLNPASIPLVVAADLRKLHENLESRLRPFWSSVLSVRTVRVSIFAVSQQRNQEDYGSNVALASKEFVTTTDGSFQGHLSLRWEDLCQHPTGLQIAFGDVIAEHDLLVRAELLPPPPSSRTPSPSPSSDGSSPTERNRPPYPIYKPHVMKLPEPPIEDQEPTAVSTLHVPITHSPIRVISDIDDTVKRSNIVDGARAVFHNVFVKELDDIVIPGMGEWYTSMWSKGVRFHYVSNGPFELLPVVSDFLQVSQLPPGSIKLKSYAGRSLFNGLLSAPAARKRAGIQDILDAFPTSRFILIGDSGEQDLELYAEFAKERPEQVLGVFIRYAEETAEMIQDPTGWQTIGASSIPAFNRAKATPSGPTVSDNPPETSTMEPRTPRRNTPKATVTETPKPKQLSLSIPAPYTPPPVSKSASARTDRHGPITSSPLTSEPERYLSPSAHSATTPTSAKLSDAWKSKTGGSTESGVSARPASISSSTSASVSSAYLRMSEPEKKKFDLQTRVYRARTQMPGHIPLRVFRSPEECVEAEFILSRDGL